MKFKDLPITTYEFFRNNDLNGTLQFYGKAVLYVFRYNGTKEYANPCKECLTYSRIEYGHEPKKLYFTTEKLNDLYDNFRRLEETLKIEPCNISLVNTNAGIQLLLIEDDRFSTYVTNDLLAIMLKVANNDKKVTDYDHNNVLTTIWDNMSNALPMLNALERNKNAESLKATNKSVGFKTWSQMGFFNGVIKKLIDKTTKS